MTVEKILDFLNEYCPFELAEEWDNAGLNVGRKSASVTKVLVALDATDASIEAAKELGAEVLLTHHPLVFDPIHNVTDSSLTGERMLKLAENGIAHIACHTNLDAAEGGVNDCLAEVCGLDQVEPFCGLGKMGVTETSFSALAERLKEKLPTAHCQGVCCAQQVKKVAVVGGSGGSMLADVIAAGCDTFVTGEVKYNHILDAREYGLNVLVLGHYETEYIVLAPLAEALQKAFPALEVAVLPYQPPMERF